MLAQIDQSGKIEDTSRNTILCLSNDLWDAVIIRARTKRQLQAIFRNNGHVRSYVLFSFAVGIACLVMRNRHLPMIVIDREYYGHEASIKSIVMDIVSTVVPNDKLPRLEFGLIGKKAAAHNRAYAIAIGKLRAKKTLTLKEVLDQIKKTEVGKRLKNA